ncbi:hypothetical protein SteCoe_1899 [Stentor coeruleus]|uniref:Uncharacterized protein n=1 Tax=Stentor coeruleus TaxID=5963 RepID=A0A1R2D0U5_9CILI|nr:hypothetical protein SteCoe_1899 [Stentor coeruleus]
MDPFGSSAYTLQKSNPTRWTFSKEDRFKTPKRLESSDFIVFPSTLSPRSTSIGFGVRWELKNKVGKDSPPPGTYELPTSFDLSKGPRMVKHTVLPIIPNRHISPGPGTYNPKHSGNSSPKYSFREKHRIRKSFDSPAPGQYEPNFTLTELATYKNIAFGFDSRRLSVKQSPNTGPGPGYYNI